MILYKYLNVEGAIAFLEKGLSYSPVRSFKDAQELRFTYEHIDVDLFISRLRMRCIMNDNVQSEVIPKLINQLLMFKNYGEELRINNVMQKLSQWQINFLRNEFAICCLTKSYDDNAMWEEFGDNHKGVMLILDIPNDLYDNVVEVNYAQDSLCLKCTDIFEPDFIRKIIGNKNISYKNENEVRLYQNYEVINNEDIDCFDLDKSTRYLYDKNLPIFLKGVEFGRECTRIADIEKLAQKCNQRKVE